MVAEVERIADWRGEEVVDADSDKLGKLDEVYVLRGTEEALLGRVKRGLLGRHAVVVPLTGSSVGRVHVRVTATPEQLERADKVGAPDVLSPDLTRELAAIYGLQIPEGADFESITLLEERRERARRARERAEQLEAEARDRAEDLDVAQGEAERSAEDVAQAQREAQQARERADQARAEADASPE